jgi:hypothetical protein
VSSALQFVGKLLDRAVHDTFRRLWPLALPCVLLDLSGPVFYPFPDVFLAAAAVEGLMENLAITLIVRSLAANGGRGITWDALRRYPASLWFVLVCATDWFVVGPVGLVPAIVLLPVGAITAARTATAPVLVMLAVGALLALIEALLIVVLITVLLLVLAGLAALMDVVADGLHPGRAFLRWLRWCFRRKAFVPTLIAAAIFSLLFFGVSDVVQALVGQLVPDAAWVRAPLIGIPDGISDTIAVVFVWYWRSAMLDRELGRDLNAELDARAAAVSTPA